MKFYIETEISEGKIIQQLGSTSERASVVSETMKWICDTREAEARKALIKLGWRPPKEACVMNPKHEAKVDELIANMATTIKDVCKKLYKCKGITIEKYSPDEYALAKILVTAAMKQCEGNYHPLLDEHIEDLKNLQYF